jgi:nitrite reductase (NO-forming)/hydroxylamine reductase
MTNSNQENKDDKVAGQDLILPIILGLLFVLIAAALVWSTQIRPSLRPEKASETTTAPVDMDAVIAAVNKGGCTACHTIPNVPGAVGQVGPDLSHIGVNAAHRIPGYTAKEYIRESLREPSAFTAPECPTGPCITGTMPVLQLDDTDIEVLVNYLSTLGTDETVAAGQ